MTIIVWMLPTYQTETACQQKSVGYFHLLKKAARDIKKERLHEEDVLRRRKPFKPDRDLIMAENIESVNTNDERKAREVSGNTKKAVNFLKHFRKDGLHNIVAIDPISEAVVGITRPSGHPDLVSFIEKNNGKRNLYYSVNEPKADAPDDKLKKHDIGKIHGVWLDADPKKDLPLERERERLGKFAIDLKTGENPPTYITDSGGGIQAFWLFDKPLEATKDNVVKAESLSRGLAEQYGTDFVQNVDRIMRIPYTVNIPSEKKAKAGRTRTVASVIHATPTSKTYPDMPFITPSFKAESETTFEHTELDMTAIKAPLPDDLVTRLKDTLRRDKKAHDLYYGIIEKPSRSEYDFTLTQQLVWDGYSLQDVAHILWHYTHGKGTDLTKRELIRTYNRVDNPFDGLDPGYIAQIEAQVNPILEARKQGKPLPEDLKKADWPIMWLDEMDWKYSGSPIYKNLLYQNAITVIYGESNVGKSFVAADIAGHIALGRDWGGYRYKAKKPIGVLYICAEAGKSFGKRGKALRKRLDVKRIPFFVLDAAPNFAKSKDDAEAVVKYIAKIERETGVKIGLVVVDTLATTFEGGNENSSEDMGLYISNMKYIQRYADTGVLIVHHSGKNQAAGARGHSSLRAATDTEIEVMSEKKGERYHRVIRTRKQREGESDITIKFGLMIVELGKDEDGDVIDTCHVVLENDAEFESVVPNLLEELEPGEAAVMKADQICAKLDITKLKAGFKVTERYLKALIHRDIKDSIGVLVSADGTLNVRELAFMSVPSKTIIRAYSRDREKLDARDLSSLMPDFDKIGVNEDGNLDDFIHGE